MHALTPTKLKLAAITTLTAIIIMAALFLHGTAAANTQPPPQPSNPMALCRQNLGLIGRARGSKTKGAFRARPGSTTWILGQRGFIDHSPRLVDRRTGVTP